MADTLRVLSVDWDYFVNCSAAYRYNNFPDGGNEGIGAVLSEAIWQIRYAQTPNMIKLGILQDEYECLKELFALLSNRDVPFYYHDSHAYAYPVITQEAILMTPGSIVEVTNIDFHHDFFNAGSSTEVNCGNWQRRLDETLSPLYGMNYKWICRTDSDTEQWDTYPFESEYQHTIIGKQSTPSFRTAVMGQDYDIVFVCRSSVWSPPHLDSYLEDLMSVVQDYSGETVSNRYTSEFKHAVEQQTKLYQNHSWMKTFPED